MVAHMGAHALRSIKEPLGRCKGGSSGSGGRAALVDADLEPASRRAEEERRASFVCSAQCSAREPQLEESLAPWATWDSSSNGTDMLDVMLGFCKATRSCQDPFLIFALFEGQVYTRTCNPSLPEGGDGRDFNDASLYLIGAEDLSMTLVMLLGVSRLAPLPTTPTVFGMYLSDYTCLVDRHLVGPGLPLFSYLIRDTSWAIPYPSSFTMVSQYEVEKWRGKKVKDGSAAVKAWEKRKPTAYWIGTLTGPWEIVPDRALAAIPRVNLLRLSANHPKQLQAEWSGVASYGISWVKSEKNVSGFQGAQPHDIEKLTGRRMADRLSVELWDSHKYYVNVDGVVMGGRLNKLAALGGVILQQQAGYREHHDVLLRPGVHYLPLAYDLSDLVAKVKWLQSHDQKAKEMAQRTREVAERRMRFEDNVCYVWRALEALGLRTGGQAVDGHGFRARLKEHNFKMVELDAEGGMKPTLERFWGVEKLEETMVGDRQMTKKGIEILQWQWDRLSGMYKAAHGDA